MGRILLGCAIASALSAFAAVTPASSAEMSFVDTIGDTDVATFGIGRLRGVGTGTLAVSGITGTVTKAYLYWHGPTNLTDPAGIANVSFGGTAIVGSNIGFSDDNFWGFANSQAYRADVTSIVGGDGNYALDGFLKPNAEINGASLIVFYDDGDSTNNRDVVLFHGNDANFNNPFDADGWNATLNGVDYTSGSATLRLHVSDGQNFGPSDDGTLMVNGVPIATGGIFQGDGTQESTGGVSNGSLWDIESFDITSLLSVGLNNLSLNLGGINDALALIVAQFDLPVGSAPPPPDGDVPEPAALGLLGLGIAALAARRRRR